MSALSENFGLYEKRREHDACGIGAVVNINGRQDHSILEYGKEIILNLHHRGASGADDVTGDGAGILFQIPHDFLVGACEEVGIQLPPSGKYGTGLVFGSKDEELREKCDSYLERAVKYYGMKMLGWRRVPGRNDCLGELALQAEPTIKQIFVDGSRFESQLDFERRLYLARKRAQRQVMQEFGRAGEDFYVLSLSCRTICYKGMFMAWQLFAYYPDLSDERMKSALAIVHQRYSTNTLPNWRLAQPFRYIAHNGEINTLSGNNNCMQIRETTAESSVFGEHIGDLLPVLTPGASDSACFDNMLEFMVMNGRSIPHSMMMMIPEAFGAKYHISTDKRSFYEYHASIMEPWDGPAAMVFTDGRFLAGTLDRNGLRPCRYLITTDNLAIVASEAGVVNFEPQKIRRKGRLQPGKMFLVDTQEGRLITDNEIKSKISRQKPYRRWLEQNRIELRGLYDMPQLSSTDPQGLTRKMRAFGYTQEELLNLLKPMATNGQEPVGSMGNDAPLAVLSDKPKLLFNYFKQMFAQVTNPPIDPLREGLVMSLMMFTGKRRNFLEETPEHCKQLKLPHPILTSEDLERLRSVKRKDFKVATVDALFNVTQDYPGVSLRNGINRMINSAETEIKKGACIIIVSDRNVSRTKAAIPSLLATSALHQGLIERKLRAEAGIIIESGEPREVMHFCLLSGFGANAFNPYLAFETLAELRRQGEIPATIEPAQLADNYIAAIKKGMLKTMSKMGISTLRSYHTAELFEAIGLNKKMVEDYFGSVSSRIQGVGLSEIGEDTLKRHRQAYSEQAQDDPDLDYGGDYHYRRDGECHLWNPITISRLQQAVVNNDPDKYNEFAAAANDQSRKMATLRGLFEFNQGNSIPLDDVESAEQIVKRFCTGAMSHGSISKEAHECMAIAMNRIGGMSNTGEGGENESRYELEANGDSKNCAIKQVASGRFGVTINYLVHAKEIQIKMAQGAKPGEGGQLPGHKVTQEIADMRYSTPGVTLISPPPHHDIYSIEDLAQLIYDLKCANPGVKVSVKLVSEVGVGTIAAGVAKGNADEVLISGHDGGTGASPLSSIKHAGCPWELGLAETQQVLIANGLRDRIRVQTDGQLKTGRDVVVAAMLGAEQFGFGTAVLVTMGCTLLRKCHEGTCAFGIATQIPELRERFRGKPEYIERYMMFIANEVRQIMASLGFRKLEDMIGRVDMLKMHQAIEHYKAKGLDISPILLQPQVPEGTNIHKTKAQIDKLGDHIDWKIIEKIGHAIDKKSNVQLDMKIRNVDRAVGTIVSSKVAKAYGSAGLGEDDVFEFNFTGTAGQSFGAFLAKGITLRLKGDTNDYMGKGLSGGRIIVVTPTGSPFEAHENIAVGNTLLYGATSGEAFINGMAGERFAVRNSGAVAVVEGVGDHGCEYMTGGVVVVLGQTGCNFAAGMSGGIAYVLDERQLFDTLCNLDMVELETVWHEEDVQRLKGLISRHWELTGSSQANRILQAWPDMVGKFVKVMPIDYRKAIERMRASEQRDTETVPATEEVYYGG
jgi:glutamate synthase domain-containing protein 2/glutamate synthase domain-containing protein 1/glutamate synthase domain-containing protein 3